MRSALILLLAFTSGIAVAQESARTPEAEPPEPIIITGIRLNDYRDRLAACLARNCPPNEDVDATLAYAEALFIEGDYDDARNQIRASLDRNRRHAAAYPEPVADLYRSNGRVALHMGRDREALRSTWSILETLREGIPQEDYRHFSARLEISQMQLAMGNLRGARSQLEALADRARRAGRPDIANLAELRMLWIALVQDPQGPARARLIEYSRSTEPRDRQMATGAKLLLARMYREEGEAERADALIAEVARNAGPRRTLVYAPPYQLASFDPTQDRTMGISVASATSRVSDVHDGQWIDVGFWVDGDGRVSGVEVLRRGANADWAEPLLQSIGGRRYSASADGGPSYRLERYTYTSDLEMQTGSRIIRHSPRARVEFLDLTTDEAPARLPASSEGR